MHTSQHMVPKLTFLATPQEIVEARKTFVNKELKFPSYEYLKTYERKFGAKYAGLFTAVMKWRYDSMDVFATHTFSRKTMKTESARLGIKPKHRDCWDVCIIPTLNCSPNI